ncbi:MAG: chromosomal replication initiator protein DnaA [Bacilli bacterium]|nr:chromosomal replication initiator protein DnaA [Bacilli bacterium]
MYETQKDRQLQDIFTELLDHLKKTIDSKLFDAMFSDGLFELKSIEGNKALFVSASETNATIIKSSLSVPIQDYLSSILETPMSVEILDKRTFLKRKEAVKEASDSFFKNSSLQAQFNFDSFVVGPNNRSAYTASLYAVNNPAKSNPIFLYSKSGLGKTHLLQAIGNEYQTRHPEAKVLYITSDDFLNEYVKYIKGRKADELRDFFTTVDMLLVDDIQFLAGKNDTQTMFFNVFNFLVAHSRQIVLTSDRSPEELKDLPDRLISRFQGGLTISISTPDKETLVDILKMKIKVHGLSEEMFTEDVLEYLAFHYSKNVRELEGAFTNLLFAITTTEHGNVIDLDFVKKVFQTDEKRKIAASTLSIDTIIKEVSSHYSLTENQLKSKSRIGQIALARQIAMYLARNLLNMTYQSIGKYFEKDHTTVMANVQKIESELEKDEILKSAIEKLKSNLQTK